MNLIITNRIDDGVDERRWRSHRSLLTDTLDPHFVRGGGRFPPCHECRKIIGPRQAVVHKRRTQQLPGVRFINSVLVKCLPDTLRDPTVDLPFGYLLMPDPTDVIHRDKTNNSRMTGIGVDLDLTNMRAIRISCIVSVECRLTDTTTRRTSWQVTRKLQQTDGPVGAGRCEAVRGRTRHRQTPPPERLPLSPARVR